MGRNHSVHSVSGLINKACVFHLVQCQVLRKDKLTMAKQKVKERES